MVGSMLEQVAENCKDIRRIMTVSHTLGPVAFAAPICSHTLQAWGIQHSLRPSGRNAALKGKP